MKRSFGIGVGLIVAVVLVLLVLARARPARHDVPLGPSVGTMPLYRPRGSVDPRMPVVDSVLPLGHDTLPRRAGPPPRGWRR